MSRVETCAVFVSGVERLNGREMIWRSPYHHHNRYTDIIFIEHYISEIINICGPVSGTRPRGELWKATLFLLLFFFLNILIGNGMYTTSYGDALVPSVA